MAVLSTNEPSSPRFRMANLRVPHDVHEHEGEGVMSPLAGYRNVILTPHIGGMATESQNLIGERAAQLVRAHSTGRLDDEASDEELLV